MADLPSTVRRADMSELPITRANARALLCGKPREVRCTIMRTSGRLLIASLCSILALTAGFYRGSLFLLIFDRNIHDGFAPTGGLIVGLAIGVLVFRMLLKRLSQAGR